MTQTKSLCLSLGLLAAASCWSAACMAAAMPNFTGIWRLDDQHSDSTPDIAARLRAERKLEQAAPQNTTAPASASSSSTPASGRHGGHGGGRGMGGGGMGGGGMGGGMHGGGHGRGGGNHNKTSDSDNSPPPPDVPPPLLDDDSVLNVQQDAKTIHVVFGDKDQLDGRLDGVTSQSLSGNASVQSHLDADGLDFTMQFDGEVRLRESWVVSPDGHHLIVTESWTTPAVQQPIVFKRSYDRLDI
jgi:hypothetical protein